MSFLGSVNAVDKLGRHEVTKVIHCVRGGVNVVVPSLSMVTEAVRMFHTQVQTLIITETLPWSSSCILNKAIIYWYNNMDWSGFLKDQTLNTYRISGNQNRLADQWSADLKVFEPVVNFIIGVERTGWELSWLYTRGRQNKTKSKYTFYILGHRFNCQWTMFYGKAIRSQYINHQWQNKKCLYHDVDFGLSLLDDEGSTKSQALIRVVSF